MVRFILIICLLAVKGSLFGQGPFFKTIELPNSYSEISIQLTVQGLDGFIWIGTDQGLLRYDGAEFNKYELPDPTENEMVTAIHPISADTIWIGYKSGQMALLTAGRLQLFDPMEGNPQKMITAITHDNIGNIWYSTYGEGVYVYNGSRVYNFDMVDGLSDNFVYCLMSSPDGSIWAGTDKGINICSFKKDKKQIDLLGSKAGLPDNIVTHLELIGDSSVFAGMHKNGVCAIGITDREITPLFHDEEWQFGEVRSFTIHNRELWVITEDKQIVQYVMGHPSYMRLYDREHGLFLEGLQHIAKDDEGNLWITGKGSGLVKVNLLFEIIGDHEGLDFKNIHALLADRSGNIWFFNDDALIKHSIEFTGRNTVRIYPLPLTDRMQIISLFEDDMGYIWAGSFGEGVYRIDPETGDFNHLTMDDGLVDNNILSISGKGEEIWFATLGGVSTINAVSYAETGRPLFKTIGEEGQLVDSYVYSVHVDNQGDIWFATDGNGLVRLSDGHFTEFSTRTGHIESAVVYSITEDSNGQIWFSTLKEGIYKFDDRTFENYDLDNGLTQLNITSLVTDRKDNLIIAHKNGVDILNLLTGEFSYYSAEYGLDNIDPELNTASVDVNGDIWFGTSKALIKYTLPGSGVRKKPLIVLHEPKVYLKSYDFTESKQLSSKQNHLTFEYNGLWFQNPDAVTYQYKLDGYDLQWVTTKDNSVIYPNLMPGTYRFSVRSAVDNTFSESDVASFQFQIRPPFWKSWWFILFAGAFLIGALSFYINARERTLKRKERRERERVLLEFDNLKSQVNPHFLFNSFNSLISVIEDDQEKAVEYVEKLSQFFRNILTYRDKELITLEEELKVAQDYFYINQQRYGDLLKLEIDIDEENFDGLIPPLTLQILIENAIKHNVISRSSPLKVSIRSVGEQVSVSNRIALKRTKSDSTGTGLHNIRNRYRFLSPRAVEVQNGPEYFIVLVPLINKPL